MPGSQADDYSTYVTSGSTGQPVRVTNLDKNYLPTQDAVTMFEWKMWGRTNGEKLAYYTQRTENDENAVAGAPLSFLGYETPVLRINSNDYLPQDALKLIEKHKVTHLYTAGAQIRRLAVEQQQQKLDLTNLKQILAAGDRVDEPLREMTREVLGSEIVDRYSSEEFGYLAIQCRQGNLHALMNYNWIEILDKSGNPCQVGEVGKVVITSLQNHSSPLIRYSIGDLASWGERCACDSQMPVIEQISGRVTDVIRNFSGEPRLMSFSLCEFRQNPRILEYQVLKLKDGVVFLTQLRESLDDHEENQIKEGIEQVFGERLTIKFISTDSIPVSSREKKRQIIEIPLKISQISNVASILPFL
jgi:phenylacetate-CoA ligase